MVMRGGSGLFVADSTDSGNCARSSFPRPRATDVWSVTVYFDRSRRGAYFSLSSQMVHPKSSAVLRDLIVFGFIAALPVPASDLEVSLRRCVSLKGSDWLDTLQAWLAYPKPIEIPLANASFFAFSALLLCPSFKSASM